MLTKTLKWTDRVYDKELAFELPIAIHKLESPNILIVYPGANGSIDGYEDKYIKLANLTIKNKASAVVRSPNPYMLSQGWDYNLRKLIEYVIKNSIEISGTKTPNIHILGVSIGAGAVASIAWEYPQVNKIILVAPADTNILDQVQDGLNRFDEEVRIFVGENDEACGVKGAKRFYKGCVNSKPKSLKIIPNCDHHFSGKVNQEIFVRLGM
ncbi:hypothetical protein KC660_00495 [Candidatus Dojkabacteria bacterium]|uniref:Alpha/beta hydrolase n=1 Tax=Candidatus Dojkabacteria bacterium TaxID=2099670 RepID=A0A955L2W2_9BACT|nr:hypothetical protein [Candidatus Dojkabacteria bacterium]